MNSLFAQTNIINYPNINFTDLLGSSQSLVSNLDSLTNVDDIQIISTENLLNIGNTDVIQVQLPGNSSLINVHSTYFRNDGDSLLVWYGIIECYQGNVMLTQSDQGTSGYITYSDEAYSIKPLERDYQALVKYKDVPTECAHDNEEPSYPEALYPPANICCVSSILVVYTEMAEQHGNPQMEARMLTENTRLALANSEACHTVEYLGAEKIDFVESTDMFHDRERLRLNAQANYYRNLYGADMVMMLSGPSYGSTRGISFLDEINPDYAYTITDITSRPGRHTFAHEWAHNLGARHDNDPTPGFAHAHNFGSGRTALASLGTTGHRELHYSNPDIDFNGVPTGIENTNDNVRQIDLLGCTISKYRDESGCIAVFISGPSEVEQGEPYEYCAHVDGCNGTPTYSWEYGNNGVIWNSSSQTSSCATFSTSSSSSPLLHVRVTVSCDECVSQAVFVSQREGAFAFEEGCLENRYNKEYELKLDESFQDINIYPNPVKDELSIQFSDSYNLEEDLDLVILNSKGQEVLTKRYASKDDRNDVSPDVRSLLPGTYYLIIHDSQNYTYEKLSVVH